MKGGKHQKNDNDKNVMESSLTMHNPFFVVVVHVM